MKNATLIQIITTYYVLKPLKLFALKHPHTKIQGH